MDAIKKNHSNEIALSEIISSTKLLISLLNIKWWKVLFVGILGGMVGLTYAYLMPKKYIARLTFVVEESKSGVGGLASLAGQFGIDIGGASGSGVFSGDNVLLFLKSENLCREVFLTPYDENLKISLADKYAESSGLEKKWEKNRRVGRINFFKFRNKPMPRLEDSLMQFLVRKNVLLNDLIVQKIDRKASLIEVKAVMQDEKLSQLFAERLVSIATAKYIESKTKVKVANVRQLQNRADSFATLLNLKTLVSAKSQQSLLDVNPAIKTVPVTAEISSRDKTMIATIFAEVVKNLELSKTLLSQESPLIQMVDTSTLPLIQEKTSKITALLVGFASGAFAMFLFLIGKKFYKNKVSNLSY